VHFRPGALDERQQEGERLAGPRAGLANHILAVQKHRDRTGLNGCRTLETLGLESAVQSGV
jgi:hypothetical protein